MTGTGRTRTKPRKTDAAMKTRLIIVFVVVVLFITLAILSVTYRQKVLTSENRAAVLQEQILQEEKRTQEIQELENYMKSDEYIEQVAKEKLGMVNDGEIIFKEAD